MKKRKLAFSVLWVKKDTDRIVFFDLLTEHKKQIMDTGHFDDVQILPPIGYNKHYLVILFPKSDQDWNDYDQNNRIDISQWFTNNIGQLADTVGTLIQEEELHRYIYRAQVEDYIKFYKTIFKGWPAEKIGNSTELLEDHLHNEQMSRLSMTSGMERLMLLSKEDAKEIYNEYMEKVQI